MSTTSLKLPDDLKQRVVSVAQIQGVSTHAFMINAIEQAAAAAECRANFIADAQAARQQMLDSGKGYDADDVHAYIQARIAGKKVAKPKARSWRG
jgi:predicted transcriptional regulator